MNLRLVQNVYGVEDGLVLERGRHQIKAGVLVERYQDNMVNPTFSLGQFTFNDLPSFLQNRPARFIGLTPNGAFDRYWRFTLFAFYLQDDFKIHPRVTVNAGLRYEFTTMPVDIYGRDSTMLKLSDPAPVHWAVVSERRPTRTYHRVSAWPGMCSGRGRQRCVADMGCSSIRIISRT